MNAIQELSDNAWDIGMVSGVLQGIELTTTLLPNQKEAISAAREAIKRVEERTQKMVEELTKPPFIVAPKC